MARKIDTDNQKREQKTPAEKARLLTKKIASVKFSSSKPENPLVKKYGKMVPVKQAKNTEAPAEDDNDIFDAPQEKKKLSVPKLTVPKVDLSKVDLSKETLKKELSKINLPKIEIPTPGELLDRLNRPPENKLAKQYGQMVSVAEMKQAKKNAKAEAAKAEAEAAKKAAEEAAKAEAAAATEAAEAVKEAEKAEAAKRAAEEAEKVEVTAATETAAKAVAAVATEAAAKTPGEAEARREELQKLVEDKNPVDDFTRDLLPDLQVFLAAEIADMMQEDEAGKAAEAEPVVETKVEAETPVAEVDVELVEVETPAEEAKVEAVEVETKAESKPEVAAEEAKVEAVEVEPKAEPKAEMAAEEAKAEPEAAEAPAEETKVEPIPEETKVEAKTPAEETEPKIPFWKTIDYKKYKVPAAVAAGLLLICYLGTANYYRTHFYPNTSLNGMNVSNMNAQAVNNLLADTLDDYKLKICGRNDIVDYLSAEQMGLTILPDNSVKEMILEQNGLEWPLKFFTKREKEAPAVASVDKAKIRSAVAKLAVMAEENQVEPQDAKISQYTQAEGYVVLREKEGASIRKGSLVKVISDAAVTLTEEVDLDKTDAYIGPLVRSDDEKLLAAISTLNEYSKAEITLAVGDDINVVDGSVIADWLTVDENYEVTFNEEGVNDYVKKMARKYDTAWDDETITRSYDGKTITVGNCHYGWLVDKTAEAEQLLQEVLEGAKVTRDLHYEMTANSHGAHDYGDSYVEIDLTHQTLWLYDKGELIISTPFVSGNPSKGNETHTGVFGLMYKERDATLTGQGYSSPVKYWMPFNGNEGMHDASWRSKFGGTLYAYAGSHGCVNLPESAAAIIFEHVDTNYPVIVYK